jgi:uncharacterized protein YbaR (Trm112 family)
MHEFLLEMLQCCVCGGELRWRVEQCHGSEIRTAEASCVACHAAYPVREGIGAFLAPDLQRDDLWSKAESGLVTASRRDPAIRHALLESDLADLNPADQMLRALLLEAEFDYESAAVAESQALVGMYSADYRRCVASQCAFVVDAVRDAPGPIVDLASGRGRLAVELLRELDVPVVITDFSPGVLRSDRERLRLLGLEDRASLLVMDGRRTPFREGSIPVMTTHLGLPNIGEPQQLLAELRRVVSDRLLAVSHFYPVDDEANAGAITTLGLSSTLYELPTLEVFAGAGWTARLRNRQEGFAEPTPASEVLRGMRIDGLPVAPTTLTWGVLEAV